MLDVRMKAKIPVEKSIECLERFGKSFKFQYKVHKKNKYVFIDFQVSNLRSLNDLCRRFRIRGSSPEVLEIKKVYPE